MITEDGGLLAPGEAAELLHITVDSLARRDSRGKLAEGAVIRTPGGHRRYRRAAIEDLLSKRNRGQS